MTNTSHIRTLPLVTFPIADNISFKNTIFIIIITIIDPYILHQPLKISFVFLLPPIANASGAKNVKTDVTTYLSPISNSNLIYWKIKINPTTITISHFAPEPILNILWSGMARLNSGGICKSSITLPVIPIAIVQICLDASSRNENANVRKNSDFGSSPSKPAPDIITFIL